MSERTQPSGQPFTGEARMGLITALIGGDGLVAKGMDKLQRVRSKRELGGTALRGALNLGSVRLGLSTAFMAGGKGEIAPLEAAQSDVPPSELPPAPPAAPSA